MISTGRDIIRHHLSAFLWHFTDHTFLSTFWADFFLSLKPHYEVYTFHALCTTIYLTAPSIFKKLIKNKYFATSSAVLPSVAVLLKLSAVKHLTLYSLYIYQLKTLTYVGEKGLFLWSNKSGCFSLPCSMKNNLHPWPILFTEPEQGHIFHTWWLSVANLDYI